MNKSELEKRAGTRIDNDTWAALDHLFASSTMSPEKFARIVRPICQNIANERNISRGMAWVSVSKATTPAPLIGCKIIGYCSGKPLMQVVPGRKSFGFGDFCKDDVLLKF